MLSSFQQTFVVLDGTLPEVSIVFCSQGFLDLTGYTRHQAIGRNIHFLQGPGTDKMAVQTLQRNMAKGVDTSTCLLSYRADGSVRLVLEPDLVPSTRFVVQT